MFSITCLPQYRCDTTPYPVNNDLSFDELIVIELNFGKNENPYASFFTGDFNGHSQFWWPDGDTTSGVGRLKIL